MELDGETSTPITSTASGLKPFGDEHEELLISLVSARPPLLDHRLPLRKRSRE